MKKFILIVLMFLIGLNFVNASIFAILGMQGLSFASPEIGKAVSNIIYGAKCVTDPLMCVQNKFTQETIGKVQGELFNKLCSLQPEACKAFTTAQKINGYIEQGAQVVKELQMDENGEVVSGSIKVGGNTIGLSDGVTPEVIETQTGKDMKLTFSGENSKVCFEEKKQCYANIDEKTNSFIKLDKDGDIKEADLTTNDKGSIFILGDKKLDLPANTKVTYKNGELVISGGSEEIKIYDKFDPSKPERDPRYVINYGKGGNVQFTKEGIIASSGVSIEDKELHLSVLNEDKDDLFITDNINNVKGKNNWIVANDKLMEYETTSIIDLKQGNNWIKVENGETLKLRANGHGSIFNNGMHIQSGDLISITSSKNCNSEITYTTTDVILGKENDVSCVAMSVFSEHYNYNANGDGSATLETCEGTTTPTGGSIFDIITGRVIEWITGRLTKKDILECKIVLYQEGGQPKANLEESATIYCYDPKTRACCKFENCNDCCYIVMEKECKTEFELYAGGTIQSFSPKCENIINKAITTKNKEVLKLTSKKELEQKCVLPKNECVVGANCPSGICLEYPICECKEVKTFDETIADNSIIKKLKTENPPYMLDAIFKTSIKNQEELTNVIINNKLGDVEKIEEIKVGGLMKYKFVIRTPYSIYNEKTKKFINLKCNLIFTRFGSYYTSTEYHFDDIEKVMIDNKEYCTRGELGAI